MLAHLLRNARSEAVRREFRAAPGASYIERHEVTLLARAPSRLVWCPARLESVRQ